MITKTKCFFLVILAAYGTASANIGNYEVINGPLSVERAEHATIAMAGENVTCILKNNRVNVDASFTFVNNGPATDAIMYFPVGINSYIRSASSAEYDYGISEDNPVSERPFFLYRPSMFESPDLRGGFQRATRPGDDPPEGYVVATITTLGDPLDRLDNYETLKNFRVLANGVPVNIEIIERVALTESPGENGPAGDEMPEATPYAKQGTIVKWCLYFREGETKEIRCEYAVPYDEAIYEGRPDVFKYSIRTGKGWAGSIGEGLIQVRYSNEELVAPVCFAAPGLPPAVVSVTNDVTTISWTFANFEPEGDAEIKILVGRNSGSISLPEKDISIFEKYPNGPGIVLAKRVDLKTEPSSNGPAVKKRPHVNKGALFDVYSSFGEWWRVRLNDGAEGWIRWRYVDPRTGEEHINAAFAYYLTE